jgi:hypothetical protein
LKTSTKIEIIIVLAVLLRIIFVWQFVNIKNINQWEYGEISKNLIHNNGYSLFYFENDSLKFKYKDDAKPFPSAYMPPAYSIIILPFFCFNSDFIINLLVISSQIICSGFVIFFLFRLSNKLFGEQVAILTSIFYAVIPDIVYSVVSFSPTVIFHLLILLLFDRLIKNEKSLRFNWTIIVLLTILIYLRSEFALFALLILTTIIFKCQLKLSLKYFFVIIILIMPWTIRNVVQFSQFVPLTTNLGQNLYRGNNPSDVGGWGEESVFEEIKELPRDRFFEVHLNEFYLNKAITYIKDHPLNFFTNMFRKQFELWLFNLNDTRVNNFFYLSTTILILLLFLVGVLRSYDILKFKYFYLYFLYFIFLSAIFFTLPRYQTMMKVLMLPFAALGLIWIYGSFTKLIKNK